MPNEGVYLCKKVSMESAKRIANSASAITSAIGHQGTADAFNALGFCEGTVAVNRIQAKLCHGDEAIALKVTGRLPEGSVLTLAELEAIGFEFFHIQFWSEENVEVLSYPHGQRLA